MNYTAKVLKNDNITIYAFGDLHIGAPTSLYNKAFNFVANSKENEYFIFAGDLLDNAIIDSVSDVYTQTQYPNEALKELESFFIKYQKKILGVVSGNHENRTRRKVGIDILEMITSRNDIAYDPSILVIDVSVGDGTSPRGSRRRNNYIIAIGHGYTNARTIGGKITGNARITEVVHGCDIYITGHTHQPSIVKLSNFIPDKYNKKLLQHNYYLATIPAWLGYEEYAARKFFQPTAQAILGIRLSGTTKEKQISLFIT